MSDDIRKEAPDASEAEEMTVTLTTDEGDIECAIVTILEVEGKDYIALQPLDENRDNSDGNVWLYRYKEDLTDPNKEPDIGNIDDDEEFDKVEDAFEEYLDSVEFDEIL